MQSSEAEARRYQRVFWLSALRHLPHHTALKLAGHLKLQTASQLLAKRPEKYLHSLPLESFSESDIADYEALTRNTMLWHGSGRYQHHDGTVIDVLESILRNGSLRPVADNYALLVGGKETVSISATPLRMIARSYADIHGLGEHEPSRYGSSLWWVAYYYGLFYAKIFTRYGIQSARNWRRWSESTRDGTGQRCWGKKVNPAARSVWDVFGMGSDIPGNFPVLFGVGGDVRLMPLPRPLSDAEVRIGEDLPLRQATHLEVPARHLPVVEAMVRQAGYDMPVMSIELGEAWAARQAFDTLLSDNSTVRPL